VRTQTLPLTGVCAAVFFCAAWSSQAAGLTSSKTRFVYHDDASGKTTSARIIHTYYWKPIVHEPAKFDPRINSKLIRAATFAEERANARSKGLCWHYVKTALVASGAVNSYPTSTYAAEAGTELMRSYGFIKLSSVHDPYSAPVGAVLVYGSTPRGHVEIRTRDGFVSDYHSKNRCYWPFVAAYAKLSSQ
jgi:hypothetical protein